VAGKGFEGGDVAGKMVGSRMMRADSGSSGRRRSWPMPMRRSSALTGIGFGSTPQKSWNGCRRASQDSVASWSWAAASSHIRR
jgi:hypothetical protein